MKKPHIYLAAFALTALATTALALDLSNDAKAQPASTPSTTPSATTPAPVGDTAVIGAITGASPTTPDETLIPIVVRTRPDKTSLSASVTNLQTKGQELGIEAMAIEGINNDKPTQAGTKEVNIMWGTASVMGKNGEKYTTHITKPLNSTVETPQEGDVQAGNQFTAKGDPNELIAAWGRLQQLMEAEETSPEAKERKPEDEAKTSKSAGGTQSDEPEDQIFTPKTEVKANPVITSTSNGCNINIDRDQMVAIVQERTLEDGKEIIACQDTLTRYPLEKKYNVCPVSIQDGQVFEQYTLNYKDPVSGGSIQVDDCTPDPDRAKTLTLDTASCSIRHDMNANQSFQMGKKTYQDANGGVVTIQDCQDTGVTYPHVVTRDTCSPVINMSGKTVTQQTRRKISIDGVDQFITECAPEASSTAIEEEICSSPRYTHDMPAKTSYLNKTLFYMDEGSRVELQNCQRSDVSFEHKQEATSCTPINHDEQRQTVMYAKTYIEETAGTPVYLSECQAISPAIPYIKTGDKWKVQSTAKKTFEPTEKDLKPVADISDLVQSEFYTGASNCPGKRDSVLYKWWNINPAYPYKGNQLVFNKDHTVNVVFGIGGNSCRVNSSAAATLGGTSMCLTGPDASNWTTTDGIKVDPVDSTTSPTTVGSLTLSNMSEAAPSGGKINVQMSSTAPASANFTCEKASCDMTTVFANPVYTRGDNSTWTDLSTVTGTRYVCGNGLNLDGKVVNE